MPELPPPLPPGERTVGQLIAETIRAYGDEFWRLLPLGLPLAVVDQLCVKQSIGVQMLVYWAALPLFVVAYVRACALRPATPRRRGLRSLVAAARSSCRSRRCARSTSSRASPGSPSSASPCRPRWSSSSAFRDCARPRPRARNRRLRRTRSARSPRSSSSSASPTIALERAPPHPERQRAARVALFLSDLVLSPLLYLGGAMLYVDQAARVGSPRPNAKEHAMPIYILLSTLTQQGVQTLKSNPERLLQVNHDVEELGCQVLHQWATLGEFDFVNVVEAPDIATIAKVSVSLAARGSIGSRRCRRSRSRSSCGRSRVVRTGQLSCRRCGEIELRRVRDPRIDEYARLLVDRSIGVQPGWQVLVRGNAARAAARRGGRRADRAARRLPDPPARVGARRRPVCARGAARGPAREPRRSRCASGRSATRSSRSRRPENAREGPDLSDERRRAAAGASRRCGERQMAMEVPWVICEYPTKRRAGGRDDARGVRGVRLRRRACSTGTPRPSGCARSPTSSTRPTRCGSSATGTDLTLSLAGRTGAVDDGHINMPGGEVFYSPVEDSAEGVIDVLRVSGGLLRPRGRGRAVRASRAGAIVEASAATGEDFLLQTLDTDDGARRARRARDRLQSRHPAVHEERRLRREDRRHGPSRGRQLVLVDRRHERERDPLGHRQGPPHGGRLYADGRLVQERRRWQL